MEILYDNPLYRPPSEANSLIFQITLGAKPCNNMPCDNDNKQSRKEVATGGNGGSGGAGGPGGEGGQGGKNIAKMDLDKCDRCGKCGKCDNTKVDQKANGGDSNGGHGGNANGGNARA
jgi:hypothetical protein